MSKYVILAESGCDLDPQRAKQHGIAIVPMHVSFGQETRDDGTFPVEEIFAYYRHTGYLPKTSGCTPDDFARAFDVIEREHPGATILYLAYSASTTCSYQSAQIAAQGRGNILSVDTKHVSVGQGMVVLAMAKYLEDHPGCAPQQAVEQAHLLSRCCRMGFFPGDLAYLKAGGRVSNAAYLGARILSLNPLIELQSGKLQATKKYRGKMDAVAPKLLQDFAREQRLARDGIAFVYSPGLHDETRAHVTAQAKELGFEQVLWFCTGGVIATHSGPGAFGVCGFAEETNEA
jgi:DegV family protein with EDD domain